MSQQIRAATRLFVWMAALWIGYQLLEDTPGTSEFIAGAVVALIGAGAASRLYAVSRWKYPGRWSYLARLRSVPWSVIKSTAVVGVAIVRSIGERSALHGDMERLPFERGAFENPDDAVRRALVTYGLSVSPNTVVCAIEEDSIVVHRLVGVTDIRGLDHRWPL